MIVTLAKGCNINEPPPVPATASNRDPRPVPARAPRSAGGATDRRRQDLYIQPHLPTGQHQRQPRAGAGPPR